MKKVILALATSATIAVTALANPSPAEAGWRGGGWGGGWGPGLAGGLIAGAVIGGIASNAYAYRPGYGYNGGPGYGYGGYAPAYYQRAMAMAMLPHTTADTRQDMLQPTTVPAESFVAPMRTAALATIRGIAIAGDRRSADV